MTIRDDLLAELMFEIQDISKESKERVLEIVEELEDASWNRGVDSERWRHDAEHYDV